MKHYRISVSLGKKGNSSRRVFVRGTDIMDAYDISKKIRGARMHTIVSITYEEYMRGVASKYES